MQSTRWVVAISISLALTATPAPLDAQARVAPGARLQARSGPTRVTGTVVSLNETALMLRRDSLGDTLELPLGSLSDVRVAEGRERSIRNLRFGWIVGAGLGFGIARAAGKGDEQAAGVPMVVGAVLGGLAGLRVQTERWLPAPIVVPAPPRPAGAAQLALAPPDSARPVTAAPDSAAPRAPADRRDTVAGRAPPAPDATDSPYLRNLRVFAGERVRYESPEAPGVKRIARVLRVEGDTIVLLHDTLLASPVRVEGRSLRALEFSQGWSRRGNRTGAMIGMLLGAGAAYLAYQPNASGDYFGLGIIIFGGLGVGIGGTIGAAIGDTGYRERWGPTPRPAVAAAPPRARPSVRLTLRP